MPFRYRLQKILNFRIQKKDEQLEVVKKAEQEVIRIQGVINEHKQTVSVLRQNMYSAPHTMMESYDSYLKHLYGVIEGLEDEKQEAIKVLNEEREVLAELEKGVKVLEKHKEKAREAYLLEEKKAEMKLLDEVAGVRHFRSTLDKKADEAEDLGINIDEY